MVLAFLVFSGGGDGGNDVLSVATMALSSFLSVGTYCVWS